MFLPPIGTWSAGTMNSFHSIEAQIARLMWVFGVRTQTELADALGIRQATVSEGLRNGSIPASWFLCAVEKTNVRPQWLRTGEGPMTYRVDEAFPQHDTAFGPSRHSATFLHGLSTSELMDELRRRKAGTP